LPCAAMELERALGGWTPPAMARLGMARAAGEPRCDRANGAGVEPVRS